MYLFHPTPRASSSSTAPLDPLVIPSPSRSTGLFIKTRAGKVVQATIPENCVALQTGETVELLTSRRLAATPHFVNATAATLGRNALEAIERKKEEEPETWGKVESGTVSRETLAVFLQVRAGPLVTVGSIRLSRQIAALTPSCSSPAPAQPQRGCRRRRRDVRPVFYAGVQAALRGGEQVGVQYCKAHHRLASSRRHKEEFKQQQASKSKQEDSPQACPVFRRRLASPDRCCKCSCRVCVTALAPRCSAREKENGRPLTFFAARSLACSRGSAPHARSRLAALLD